MFLFSEVRRQIYVNIFCMTCSITPLHVNETITILSVFTRLSVCRTCAQVHGSEQKSCVCKEAAFFWGGVTISTKYAGKIVLGRAKPKKPKP